MAMSKTIFFRLLAYAPEELQRQAKDDARRAIPALCFTEDDIRRKFAEEERWDELTEDMQRVAVSALLDADEYSEAGDAAHQSIAEAVARYLHETAIEESERQADSEVTG
jgi:hypothetical protein